MPLTSINWAPILPFCPSQSKPTTTLDTLFFLEQIGFYKMSRFMFICFVLLIVAVDHVSSASSGCTSRYGCIYPKLAEYNRKMLLAMKREQLKRDGKTGVSASTSGESERTNFNDAELRSVPAGPDPLHHNGGTPKMPRSSP